MKKIIRLIFKLLFWGGAVVPNPLVRAQESSADLPGMAEMNQLTTFTSNPSPNILSKSVAGFLLLPDSAYRVGSKEYFMQLSQKNRTAAWILLGAGTAMMVGGAAAFGSSWDSGTATETDIAGFIVLGGVIADVVSIPFFITAARHKRRAMTFSAGSQLVPVRFDPSNPYQAQATISLLIYW